MAAVPILTTIAILISFCTFTAQSQPVDFLYNGFNGTTLILDGATVLKPTGALRLTNKSHNAIGHAFHPQPILMLNKTSSSNASSFSTYFVFAILPSSNDRGGYGIVFTLSPEPGFPGAEGEHYMGVLNSTNDGNSSNHIFMVEFDTVNGYRTNQDSDWNHVGINNNTMKSRASEPAAYYVDDSNAKEGMKLESGEAIQAWIDYDGVKKVLNVTISPSSVAKPRRPLISEPIDLTPIVKERMYAGFSAATGPEKASSHYILGWSFRLNGVADPLDLSRLPVPPANGKSSSLSASVRKALIATLSVVVFLFFGAFVSVLVYRRVKQFEVLEDWEVDCPHRFRYRDLHRATKGFNESEVIGSGGFGAVYKGVLPSTGTLVAVKKIRSDNSRQGMREFAAEIESLGKLRHKHLVNLQGWCKNKNDLLLVYDYVSNGSLDSLLYGSRNEVVLTWDQRFNIIKGIAAGLLYLHEEWGQVVIHRDVKSSNILIDGDMNARLGDFGLARFYDHGKISHTTNVVGTIGYIAPELTRTGKASTSSDVFAFGILLFEVACGRAPIAYDPQRGHVVLIDWVIECLQQGKITDASDPKLNNGYVAEEMELVLGLGLLCSHPKQESRPSMRQVTRYLNGDELLPVLDNLSTTSSRRNEEIRARFLEVISTDLITTSIYSSSLEGLSSSSFDTGR